MDAAYISLFNLIKEGDDDVGVVREFLDFWPNIDVFAVCYVIRPLGNSPFEWACKYNQFNIARFFLQEKWNEDKWHLDTILNDALSIAFRRVNVELCIFLLSEMPQSCVNNLNRSESDLVHAAVDTENLEILDAVIKKGFDVNAANFWGDPPLKEAIKLGNKEIMMKLIAAGANVNALDENNEPIIFTFRKADVLFIMLAAGADPNLTDSNGTTCLYMCTYGHEFESVETLLSFGANPYTMESTYHFARAYQIEKALYLFHNLPFSLQHMCHRTLKVEQYKREIAAAPKIRSPNPFKRQRMT